MTMLLELKNIAKKYDLPSGKGHTTVLKDISLQVRQGESIAIVGPSGSGKSTLLNIMGTLDRPSSGVVSLFGKNLVECDDTELSHIRNREIGFVFQLHHLLPQCTVLENVFIPTVPLGLKKQDEDVRNRARKLLERVGLSEHMEHFPAQLSGGEMQRVAVVRALINKPKLVLADEPTGSLDKDSSENLGRLMVEINKEEGTALIVVTHSIEFAGLMEKGFRLQNGILEKFDFVT
jgi:ABC-type lipoprotein export system ATPase subunit